MFFLYPCLEWSHNYRVRDELILVDINVGGCVVDGKIYPKLDMDIYITLFKLHKKKS